jgi:hypothetical protein
MTDDCEVRVSLPVPVGLLERLRRQAQREVRSVNTGIFAALPTDVHRG